MSFLQVTWTDPATRARGYLVIDRLVRGVSSGGLRMRAGCTLDEVRGLAEGMTAKEALNYDPGARYVPLGGAKGGIDFDPYDPRAEEVLTAYLFAMSPYIERFWTMGGTSGSGSPRSTGPSRRSACSRRSRPCTRCWTTSRRPANASRTPSRSRSTA
jgi:glutamate dehydrogenase (NAD(P)+)